MNRFFGYNGKHYYADLTMIPFCRSECMIFEVKDGNIDWSELYCKRGIPVTEKELIKCIKEFCKELKCKYKSIKSETQAYTLEGD